VQWHPERMTNSESVFSKNIKQSFLDGVRNI
jgi:gamma-glutamyl-gamma-aminobutyrate hydrolase PuuD